MTELFGLNRQTRVEPPEKLPFLAPQYLDTQGLARDLSHELVFNRSSWTEQPISAERRKVALAISGGGAAGAYTAGVIEALVSRLRERGVEIDLLVGTSAGALNAYGVFVERLGLANPQLSHDPELRQPYGSFIASIWSYLDRHQRTSAWVTGRRAWIVNLASRGFSARWVRWSSAALVTALILALNPFLLAATLLLIGADRWLPFDLQAWGFGAEHALHFGLLGLASFVFWLVLAVVVVRKFRRSLFRDVPLLRLLANTGPDGDLSRNWSWSREKTVDRARVLSREIVDSWYQRRDEPPELILTATDISQSSECLFTLVRPETYRRLVSSDWMAVQLDSSGDGARPYRAEGRALLSLPENFLHCVLGATAVPGAFPAQQLGIYGPDGRREVRHTFVDGGFLNNSPVHIAIDAGATHIISLEVEPLGSTQPLATDDGGEVFHLFGTALETFSTLLELSTCEDIRRTVTWNRFLVENPEVFRPEPELEPELQSGAQPKTRKRVIPLYRIAPETREIGTVEFDGHYQRGKCVITLRDWLRRGYVDLQGRHIWRATLQTDPEVASNTGGSPGRDSADSETVGSSQSG